MSSTKRVVQELAKRKLLLTQDKVLPNVVTLVTGEFVSSSWWSHPRGKLVFAVLSELADHPDVLFTKLLSGKVTLVHRSLWSAFVAVAKAQQDWQMRGLSLAAKRLLQSVEERGSMSASGAAVKELEKRLLVHTREVHAESGRHEILFEAWAVWARRMHCVATPSLPSARCTLEAAILDFGARASAIPWRSPKRTEH